MGNVLINAVVNIIRLLRYIKNGVGEAELIYEF